MGVIELLDAAVRASGLSKKQVAARANMTPYRLSRLLNGHLKKPSLPAIEAVLDAIGKRLEDLFVGTPSNEVRQALRVLTEYVDRHEVRPTPVLSAPVEAPRIRSKKRRSRIVTPYPAAANPNAILLDAGETPRKRIPTELWNRGARRGALVVGDSMIDAGIRDGDVVFYAPEDSRRVARGKIVVIRVNTGVYIKYYKEIDDQKMLLSAKAGLDPMFIKPGDEAELYGIVLLPKALTPARTP